MEFIFVISLIFCVLILISAIINFAKDAVGLKRDYTKSNTTIEITEEKIGYTVKYKMDKCDYEDKVHKEKFERALLELDKDVDEWKDKNRNKI